jgi:hypothetical protein
MRAVSCLTAKSMFVIGLCHMLDAGAQADEQPVGADTGSYSVTYRTDWGNGIDPRISRHGSGPGTITTVPLHAFNGFALKTTMSRNDDFTGGANGSPRAELAFAGLTRFEVGSDYERVRGARLAKQDGARINEQRPREPRDSSEGVHECIHRLTSNRRSDAKFKCSTSAPP